MTVKPKYVCYINVSNMTSTKAKEHVLEIKKLIETGDNYENEQWYFIPSDKNEIVVLPTIF